MNVPDADVGQFLLRFTFLPVAEVDDLCAAKDQKINDAKRLLAEEITTLVHGAGAAREAAEASRAAFGSGEPGDLSGVPFLALPRAELEKGLPIVELLVRTGLCATKSDARRLVSQGGAYVSRKNITDINALVSADAAEEGTILLRAGKKRYFRIVVS